MPLIQLVVILILIGVGLYFVNKLIPMAQSMKTIINVVVVVVVVLWIIQLFGFFDVGPVIGRPHR